MNFKLRFKNKTTLIALIAALAGCAYQILGIIGITAPVTQDATMQAVTLICNILVGLGVLVDPTTRGIGDSQRAMNYNEPK